MKNKILTIALMFTGLGAAVAVLTAAEPMKGAQQLLPGGAKARVTATCVSGKACATVCTTGAKTAMNCGSGCMPAAKAGHVHGGAATAGVGGCAMGGGGCCAGKAPSTGGK
jgi:hypothetical protein